jgi:hypothetical protein
LKFASKTTMPKPIGDTRQSSLPEHGQRQASKWRTLHDLTSGNTLRFHRNPSPAQRCHARNARGASRHGQFHLAAE